MFFFQQFEKFDPLSGDVPSHPFSYLPEIAYRARALLQYRTAEQITSIAKMINERVDGYFSDLKYSAILELKEKLASDEDTFALFFEWDGGTVENGKWLFKDDMEDELDIQTSANTSEVDALKTIIENRGSWGYFIGTETVDEGYPEGKDYELFAVLSLWLLADAMERMNDKSKYGLSIAGEYAIKAMDAVCYAEHLREVDWLLSYAKRQANTELTEALTKQTANHKEWMRSYENGKNERILMQKSKRAKELNALRHQETNIAKNLVIGEWDKNRNQFPSGEQAGLHYADWLETQAVFHKHSKENNTYEWYTQRTVTKWIRDYAKGIGFLFRP